MKFTLDKNSPFHLESAEKRNNLKEDQYDDDISNIENAFNIDIESYLTPDAPITSNPLFIMCNAGIFCVEDMTLDELVELIRANKFQAIEIETIPSALFEKLSRAQK